jgi:hypothetical protein
MVESAEGTAPSAARRTRREPLDSPGSHCSNRKIPSPAPVRKQSRGSALDAVKPDESPELVTTQAFVFPHGPTNHHYQASGLNLVTTAVVLWNTVYLARAGQALRGNGHAVDGTLLRYLSPLGWEHINLTGDYFWRSSAKLGKGKFRPLRSLKPA